MWHLCQKCAKKFSIKRVKGDIKDLKEHLKTSNVHKKKPAKSEYCVEIDKLKVIVGSLKDCLEHQELCAHNIENDLVHAKELERGLKMERMLRKKLQRENEEFQHSMLCDKKRGGDNF